MSTIQKKSKAGVSFTGTATGKLDESALGPDEHTLDDHYLYGSGDVKGDYSYPVVDASGDLRRGNVDSAWSVGARGGVDEDSHKQKLRSLGEEFDTNPIPDEEESMKFTKHAEIAKVDDDRNVVVGVAMEPGVVDQQGDFERPETIRRLSEGYMERLASGESKSGVMHAAFKDDALSHVENRVLAESKAIGGDTYPAGSWQVGVKVHDDALQSLINSETLTGFSIGGHIHDADRHQADALPDGVTIDDGLQEAAAESDEPIREITDATIKEISLVDEPAVQRATIQTAKGGGLAKAADELTSGVEPATQYLIEQRGHDEAAARELAGYLNDEKATADDENTQSGSWISRAKRFFSGSSGGSDGEDSASPASSDSEKAGRTLSGANVSSARMLHDVALDMLSRSDIDHGRRRFSDDPTVDFDAGNYGAAKTAGASQADEAAESASDAGGDFMALMNKDEFEDVLKDIQETQEEQNERIGALETDGDEEKDDEEKTTDDEPPEWGENLIEAVNENAENIARMAEANGVSQQGDVERKTSDGEMTKADFLGLPGGGD